MGQRKDWEGEVQRLQAANAFLAEQCRGYRQMLPDGADLLPLEWGLTAKEAELLALLTSREFWSYRALLNALYATRHDAPDHQKILTVWVCKIKRKLGAKAVAVNIQNIWGRGYSMAPESRAFLKAKMGDR